MSLGPGPLPFLAELRYDSHDRLTQLDRDGLTWSLQHHAASGLAAVAYPDGARECFDRTADGGLRGYVDRNGHETRFARDGSRRSTQLVDANGNTTSFRYSVWDRPDKLVRPDGVSEELVRDGSGYPREVRVDGALIAKPQFEGDRLSQIRYADGEHLTFAYDGQGRITEASTGELNVLRSYDEEGRLVREQIGDQVVEASYAFDGQLQTLTGCGSSFSLTSSKNFRTDRRGSTKCETTGTCRQHSSLDSESLLSSISTYPSLSAVRS